MKEIKVVSWEAKMPDGKMITENIVTVLSLILGIGVDSLPGGMESFRLMRRLAECFDEAEKSGVIKLEDKDYVELKKLIEKHIPARLAGNPKIYAEVERFLNA